MIVEYLRYEIDDARQAKFIEDYKAGSEVLLTSPYATYFDMCQCDEDPRMFILRIEWTSAEDHLEKFRGSEIFRKFFTHVRAYVQDIVEMRHYTRL